MIRRRVPWIALRNNHGTPTTDQLRYHTCTYLEHTHCRQPPSGVAWHAARLSFSGLATLPPPHTGYTSNWTSTGVAIPGIVTIWRAGRDGQSPSAPHLPLFDRLGPFAIDGHGNSSWTAQQRHGERTNTFSGFNEAALAAPPSDAQMIPRHWPLGPARRKPCGPSCITYTFGACVRPQEMLCSSQTRSRKPTDGGGSRFPLSMRFPPPRKPNPVRSGALGRAGGMGVAIVAGAGRGWMVLSAAAQSQDLPWARDRRSSRVSGSRLERHTYNTNRVFPAVQCRPAHQAWSPFPRDAPLPAPTQVPVRYPGDSSPATKLEGHPGGIQGPHVRGSTVHRAGTKAGQKEQRRHQACSRLQVDSRPWPERRHQHGNSHWQASGGGGGFLQVKMEHRWCFHHGGQQQLIPGRHPVTWNLSRLPQEPKPDSCDFQNSGQSPLFLRRPRLPNTA